MVQMRTGKSCGQAAVYKLFDLHKNPGVEQELLEELDIYQEMQPIQVLSLTDTSDPWLFAPIFLAVGCPIIARGKPRRTKRVWLHPAFMIHFLTLITML